LADQTGGPNWRTCLADLGGGPCWRCRPWRPSLEPRLISDLRCDERQVSDGVVWALAFGVLRLALSDWRSHLAVSVGGVSWRTTLADQLGGVTRGGVGLSRNPSAHFDARIGRFPAGRGGHRQLALSDWRTNLAVSVGGPEWRCCLWRCGFEPRPISELRCEDRQVAGSPLWTPTIGALWLTLCDFLSNLAVSVGGPGWRSCLWRSGFEPRPINQVRCEDRQVAGSPLWSPAVGALWLAEQIGGLV
jgi:hypothetical protein